MWKTTKQIGYSRVFKSETEKIRTKIIKYLEEKGTSSIIDIGCGTDKLTTDAFGVDGRNVDGVDFVLQGGEIFNLKYAIAVDSPYGHRLPFSIVYSSHCLEHLPDDVSTLKSWMKLMADDGYMILYLPDDRWYDNSQNPEHLQIYTYPEFIKRFEKGNDLDFLTIVESGEDHGFDRYSFYVVLRKAV